MIQVWPNFFLVAEAIGRRGQASLASQPTPTPALTQRSLQPAATWSDGSIASLRRRRYAFAVSHCWRGCMRLILSRPRVSLHSGPSECGRTQRMSQDCHGMDTHTQPQPVNNFHQTVETFHQNVHPVYAASVCARAAKRSLCRDAGETACAPLPRAPSISGLAAVRCNRVCAWAF